MRRLAAVLAFFMTVGGILASEPQSVGLVLSGGGAKGIAHIGVIQALEDNDIPIDYITGTSMGAIVGGLYSCGYTPAEMMALIESKSFEYWSTGQIDKQLTYFFSQPEPTPALMKINLGDRDSKTNMSILPTSLINPLPMNFAFMELFAPYTAQCGGNFNNLFVPFRCVTSNVDLKHKVVCSSGNLGDAIRASMSFPLVFYPIERNGALMYDGGIYDNFPVSVMKDDFAPSIMIGVDVTTASSPATKNSRDVINQLENMIMQHSDYNLPADEGIKIHIDLQEFSLLDFQKARTIYEIGYRRGMAMMDSIKARVTSRIPAESRRLRRSVFKSQTPYLRFDSVQVTGGTRQQDEYLAYIFDHNRPDTFGIKRARDAYYRAITPGKLTNLQPQAVYNDSTGLFKLDLQATMKDKYELGFGGYVSSSTSSMLFLSAAYRTLSFYSLDLSLNGWIGQSYMAGALKAKVALTTPIPSSLKLDLVASRQKFYESEKLFFQDNLPTFISSTEMFARLDYAMAAGRLGKVEIGLGFGHLESRFYQFWVDNASGSQRDYTRQNLAQIEARYVYNSLDNLSYPTSGTILRTNIFGVMGHTDLNHSSDVGPVRNGRQREWIQGDASLKSFIPATKNFSIGLESNLLLSTRHLFGTYTSSIVDAPAFNPTPSSYNIFDPAFRANNYFSVGTVPVWKIGQLVQIRSTFHCFVPLREIKCAPDADRAYYGKWVGNPRFFGEVAGVVSLPFASLAAYANYANTPASRWNFGLSLGVFILAPRFLR